MASFRDKTQLLTQCSNDIKLLLREGYDVKEAKETAEKFFGKKKISFIAIDGTESQVIDTGLASKNNQTRVKGAFKNVISAERMFVKSYIQLWQSENDHIVRRVHNELHI